MSADLREVHVGLSLMIEPDFLAATLPLFERDLVDVLEWSVDLGWTERGLPSWADELLAEYSERNRLFAHGVHASLLSARDEPRHDRWFHSLAREMRVRRHRSISEHFGFSTIPGMRYGAPLPVPWCKGALAIGHARLARLREVSGVPVGLENLALAFDARDAWAQGPFLEALLAPTDGFLHLDLHNLWCQIQNFALDPIELLESYPLERARIVHVSGGSWSPNEDRIRQDTHDEEVPREVLDLVRVAIPRLPRLEAVVFERLGGTIAGARAANRLRADYEELRAVVAEAALSAPIPRAHPVAPRVSPSAHDEAALASFQESLHRALRGGEESALAFRSAPHDWREITASYEPRMLKLAAAIVNRYTVMET